MAQGKTVNHDRYRLNEYKERHDDFAGHSQVDQQSLGELLRRSEIVYASSKGLDHALLRALPLRVHLANSTSANVGRTLVDLEIELRRVAAYLTSGSLRPSRDNQTVEVISAQHMASIQIVVAVALEIYGLLTSRPVEFLSLLDWFWSHRHNRTKVRLPYEETDPTRVWTEMVAEAKRCDEAGRPVVVTVTDNADGSTRFGFKSQ
jgi:hypothetical protein